MPPTVACFDGVAPHPPRVGPHVGARNGLDDPGLEQGIRDLLARVEPDLVVASGDLTHGGRPDEHDAAAEYLRGLDAPLLVIPGNHDIPPFTPARFTRPWREFERNWGTTTARVLVARGACRRGQLCAAVGVSARNACGRATSIVPRRNSARQPAGALRVVAVHHQLANAPWRWRKLPTRGAQTPLSRTPVDGRRGADRRRPHTPERDLRPSRVRGARRRRAVVRGRTPHPGSDARAPAAATRCAACSSITSSRTRSRSRHTSGAAEPGR